MRELHDYYFRQAKSEGYRSRAAYKLIEIDDRRQIMKRGDRVLDCGAAPGSWMQVAAQRVGPRGFVVGFDLQVIEPLRELANVAILQGDLADADDHALLRAAGFESPPSTSRTAACFDVILSDMAPNTSGDRTSDHHRSVRLCELVLQRARSLLKPGGNLVMKVFEGERGAELLGMVKQLFEHVKTFKPKASRSESFETYIIALGYRHSPNQRAEGDLAGESDERQLPPKVKRGWGNP